VHKRQYFFGVNAAHKDQHHPCFDVSSGHRGWEGATRRMGSPVRELLGRRGYARLDDGKEDDKEAYALRAVLIHRESWPRRPGGLVWKRKAEEAGSSVGVEGEATILVGSVPCRLPVGDMQPGEHTSKRHGEGKVLHAPENMHGERAKRSRLVLVKGRSWDPNSL
jgi:hypothetical protein